MKLKKMIDPKTRIGVLETDDGRFYAGYITANDEPANFSTSLFHRTEARATEEAQSQFSLLRKIRNKNS